MGSEFAFVPRILLCGDEAEFLARVGQRPFKIVGHAQIVGEVDGQPLNFLQDGKIFLDGKIQHVNELLNALTGGGIDYLVFNSTRDTDIFRSVIYVAKIYSPKVITLEFFKSMPREFFYDVHADMQLMFRLKTVGIKTLLDVDAYFAKGVLFTNTNDDTTAIDCVSDKPMLPIKENFYRRVYKNFAEVGFRRYDAALIAERSPVDFVAKFVELENFSERVITFARKDSELERYIIANAGMFSAGERIQTAAGNWFFLTRHVPQETFCIYVVTHKKLPPEHVQNLPEGYKIIHAGRALNPDLGYLGDHTGDNISHLNLYINEITALYWFWKNANDSIVGLAHYRRFFTTSDDPIFAYEKILTREEAQKILETYDMIIAFGCDIKAQREAIIGDCGVGLVTLGEATIKKHMLRVHPDYLDALDYALGLSFLFRCNMFVTRRNIFDAYCKWLFSFILDAMDEILKLVNFDDVPTKPRRLMGYLVERLFGVWLLKNRLRIKEMKVMHVEGL